MKNCVGFLFFQDGRHLAEKKSDIVEYDINQKSSV